MTLAVVTNEIHRRIIRNFYEITPHLWFRNGLVGRFIINWLSLNTIRRSNSVQGPILVF